MKKNNKFAHLYEEFSPQKLEETEKELNLIAVKCKKGRIISVISVIFTGSLLGMVVAFSLRYVGKYQQVIDFSEIALLYELQKYVDGLHSQCGDFLRIVFPVFIALALSVISCVISIVVVLLMHLIKNCALKNKVVTPIGDEDNLEKVKRLIDKASTMKRGVDEEVWGTVFCVLYVITSVAFVLLNFSGEPKEHIWKFIVMAVLALLFLSFFGIVYMVVISMVDDKLGSYEERMETIKKILDSWWVKLDSSESEKRHAEYERKRKCREEYELEVRMNKSKESQTPKTGVVVVPRIDVSDM